MRQRGVRSKEGAGRPLWPKPERRAQRKRQEQRASRRESKQKRVSRPLMPETGVREEKLRRTKRDSSQTRLMNRERRTDRGRAGRRVTPPAQDRRKGTRASIRRASGTGHESSVPSRGLTLLRSRQDPERLSAKQMWKSSIQASVSISAQGREKTFPCALVWSDVRKRKPAALEQSGPRQRTWDGSGDRR